MMPRPSTMNTPWRITGAKMSSPLTSCIDAEKSSIMAIITSSMYVPQRWVSVRSLWVVVAAAGAAAAWSIAGEAGDSIGQWLFLSALTASLKRRPRSS